MWTEAMSLFGKIPLLAVFTNIWVLQSSCMLFSAFFTTPSWILSPDTHFFFFSFCSHFQWPTSPSAPMSQQVQETAKQGLTVKRIRLGDRTVPRADSMELLISLVLTRIQLRSQGIFQFIKFVDCSFILYWLLLVTTLGSVASLVVYKMFPEGPGHQ